MSSLLYQLVYYIQKYSISTLYPTSSGTLAIDYPDLPVAVITSTLAPSTQQTLKEFKDPYEILLLPDIYRVKVDLYASGQQSSSNSRIAVQLLINDTLLYTSSFQKVPYTDSPGSLWYDIYVPGLKETDQLSLKIIAKNASTNSAVAGSWNILRQRFERFS